MITVKLTGDWDGARRIVEATAKDVKEALRVAIRQEAEDCRSEMIQGIINQAPGGQRFAPLAASTLAFRRAQAAGGAIAKGQRRVSTLRENAKAKEQALTSARRAGMYVSRKKFGTAYSRFQKLQASIQRARVATSGRAIKAVMKGGIKDKALIQNGDLIGGIRALHKGSSSYIGVMRSARSKDGKSLANIARLHEFGWGPKAVQMTPRQRRYLMMMFKRIGSLKTARGGGGVLIVRGPARPFVRPIFDQLYGDKTAAGRRIAGRLAALLPVGAK